MILDITREIEIGSLCGEVHMTVEITEEASLSIPTATGFYKQEPVVDAEILNVALGWKVFDRAGFAEIYGLGDVRELEDAIAQDYVDGSLNTE